MDWPISFVVRTLPVFFCEHCHRRWPLPLAEGVNFHTGSDDPVQKTLENHRKGSVSRRCREQKA